MGSAEEEMEWRLGSSFYDAGLWAVSVGEMSISGTPDTSQENTLSTESRYASEDARPSYCVFLMQREALSLAELILEIPALWRAC